MVSSVLRVVYSSDVEDAGVRQQMGQDTRRANCKHNSTRQNQKDHWKNRYVDSYSCNTQETHEIEKSLNSTYANYLEQGVTCRKRQKQVLQE